MTLGFIQPITEILIYATFFGIFLGILLSIFGRNY